MAMKNRKATRRSFVQVPPLVPDAGILQKLAEAFGGMKGLVAKIHTFLTVRERNTNWRILRDAASRDRSTYGKEEADRQELPIPFPSLTNYLGSETGTPEQWSRDAVLKALAALASTPEAAEGGLSIRPEVNDAVEQPYATVSVARRGTAGLSREQQSYFD